MTINTAGVITCRRRVIGIMEGDSDPQTFIPEFIAAHRDRRFRFDRLVRTCPLIEINQAIAARGRGECVRVMPIP